MDSLNERKLFRISVIIILIIAVVASMIISLIWGSTPVSLSEIWHTLWASELTDTASQIIWNIRLPRNIVAALVGACLAVSGAILQAVMKNPLADPQIVGVSSGAGLAGVIIFILFPGYDHIVPLVAFIGAMAAALMVYALACLLWMVGGLAARSWPQVEVLFPYALVGLIFACLGAKRLTILSLGDETAKGLGLKVEQTRFIMTAVAALLAAGAVSIAGLIGFVGLVIPHMLRLIIGNDYAYLLPGSALLGALVLVVSDTIGRVMWSPIEVPVGIIMAFFGAPFFLYLLRRDN
ncbi:MAG: iron ABC transporter permease [Veillonella sp.]|nr:iron ABC transporter permease [Veillonella sp.]